MKISVAQIDGSDDERYDLDGEQLVFRGFLTDPSPRQIRDFVRQAMDGFEFRQAARDAARRHKRKRYRGGLVRRLGGL